MKKHRIILLFSFLIITLICFFGSHGQMVENMNIPAAFSTDIEITPAGVQYKSATLVYTFKDTGEIGSVTKPAQASTLAEDRQNRQLVSGKKFVFGLSRIFVNSESFCRYGMKQRLSIWVESSDINDRAICVVCKGKAEDILRYKVKGYSNSGEYIESMVKNLNQFNFFPMQYTLLDIIVRVDAEGRTVLLPYIEITEQGIKTTGLAIFSKDKMVAKADMKETKIINLLKENGVKGILTIQKNPEEYINFYAVSKRKITCTKEGIDKYKFIINVNLNGSIINNSLYKHMNESTQDVCKFEADMSNEVKKMCKDTVKIIQNDYKVDVLDLGRIAAAKFGRGTGVDWNKVICNSDIEINVKVNIDTEGRGSY